MSNRILKATKKIHLRDLLAPLTFLLLLIPSCIFRLSNKIMKRPLWLVAESGEARDNGYHFFKYVREQHPDDFCFYAIKKDDVGYGKVSMLGNVIKYGSLKHWLYYMSANYNISSQKGGNPCPIFWYIMHVTFGLYRNRVFLQHGVIKDDLDWLYYNKTKFRYFVTSTDREYDSVSNGYGYPDGSIILTGLPRWDNLKDTSMEQKEKSILIMPTWREWLGGDRNRLFTMSSFKETEYYKKWNGLLNNKEFNDYLEKNHITVYFYPHINMMNFIESFKTNSNRIIIVNKAHNIQNYFSKCNLMITDYSSVAFDFAYLGKPVIYYQFDYEEYRKKQYREGYFSYQKDGFGPVAKTEKDILREIKSILENGYTEYKERMKQIRKEKSASASIYNHLRPKKRVVHIIYSLSRGGTERYMMNLLKNTNETYDNYVLYYSGDNCFKMDLKKMGIPCIKINGGNYSRIRQIRKFIKQNKIDIVYCYTFYNSVFVLFAAILAGVRKRIVHSHRSEANRKIASIRILVSRSLITLLSTDRLACSDNAGKALYIGKSYKIVKNGIDLPDFSFNREKRERIRKAIGASNSCLVLGTIGRLDDNKNQLFMLKILERIIASGLNSKLVIIGDGENEVLLKEYAKKKDLSKNVLILKSTEKANEYYSAFDVFLLTSYKEGFPYVMLEAQANGLPIYASSSVCHETKINKNVCFIDLNYGEDKWVKKIIACDKMERQMPSSRIAEYSTENTAMYIIKNLYEVNHKKNSNKIVNGGK